MKRYEHVEGDCWEAEDGEWMRYTDHVEAMKRIAGDTIPPITAGFIRAYDEVNGPIHAAMSASKEGA